MFFELILRIIRFINFAPLHLFENKNYAKAQEHKVNGWFSNFPALRYYKFFQSMTVLSVICLIFLQDVSLSQPVKTTSAFQIARVKYSGGGDWYNDPSGEVNLLYFVRQNTNINVNPEYKFVELSSENLFSYPFIFMTGHGNNNLGAINLSEIEVRRLRNYLENGGFLYVDDDYGIDRSFRKEMKKIFPDQDLIELPFSHGIYHCHFDFPNGPPKTHEHDNKPPQGFGLFYKGRLCVYYTFESNPSDGWADPEVHKDPEEKRIEALKFGTNVIVWALTN